MFRKTIDISPVIEPVSPVIDILLLGSWFYNSPGTVLLLSGGDLDCARYNILAVNPILSIRAKRKSIKISFLNDEMELEDDPFNVMRSVIKSFSIRSFFSELPVVSGLFGYFSYDLKDCIEKLSKTSVDDLNLPDMLLYLPSTVFIEDRFSKLFYVCSINREVMERIRNFINKEEWKFSLDGDFYIYTDLKSNFSYKSYIEAVERIKRYILEGHVYQVNLSQRFEVGFYGDPFSFFKRLFFKNPAPFFAYINGGDHHIISTSPERFLLKKGEYVETRPIKGTRPRGKTPLEDERFKQELLSSIKDDAELSMIVDLLRNDLGKVCVADSVNVKEHKRLEKYDNVYHLVSIITGRMEMGKDEVDLLKATFPGGSITGCPKIRAMEIIDELEPNRRHVYTGSIGYVSFHNTMDVSIAIRTATILNNRLFFSVGGGIVFDSDPELEYEETIHKGRTFLQLLEENKKKKTRRYVWFNGAVIEDMDANIPIESPGLSYGFGFFETLRGRDGKVYFLKEHIQRFNKAWRDMFQDEPPDLTWEDVVAQVVEKNRLKGVIRIKIIAAKRSHHPSNYYTMFLSASPYIHRLREIKKSGFDLLTYPYPRQTPLADYKSLNYLYYFSAGKWVKDRGADEAIILNSDGSVSETNTGNIFFVDIDSKRVFIPISPHSLQGVMLRKVCEFLSKRGFSIDKEIIFLDPLLNKSPLVLISNSMIGVVPVLSIDNRNLYISKKDLEFVRWLNTELIEEEIP